VSCAHCLDLVVRGTTEDSQSIQTAQAVQSRHSGITQITQFL
jgi:hypothetical protein